MNAYPRGAFGNGLRCVDQFGRQGFRGDELFWPNYCDISNTGDIAIADTDNNRIQVFQAHQHTSSFPPYGGKGTADGSLNRPTSVKYCAISGCNLVVADTGNRRICLIRTNLALGKLETVSTFGATHLVQPTDVAVDRRNGNIVVVDSGLNQVLIFSHQGEYMGNLEQRGFTFLHPSSVVITHDGVSNIYVSDTGNHCIRKFTCSGDYVGVIGSFGMAEGQFNQPKGLTLDRSGYLYVADEMNNRVQMFTPDMNFVTTVISNVPLPKGVAANLNLVVTCADQNNFVKVYSQQ